MPSIDLDRISRLAEYLNWTLAEMQRETGSKLAGTRTVELLGNSAATTQELLTLLGHRPRAPSKNPPTDESITRH